MKKQWILSAVSLLILCALLAVIAYIPILTLFFAPFALALFAGAKLSGNKLLPLILWLAALAGVTVLSASFLYALVFTSIPALAGIWAGICIKKGGSVKRIFAISATGIALFLTAILLLLSQVAHTNIIESIFTSAKDIFSQMYTQLLIQNAVSSEQIEQLSTLSEQIFTGIYQLFPYLLVAISAIMGYAALWIIVLFNKIYRSDMVFLPSFSQFKCGIVTIIIFALSAIIMLVSKNQVLTIVFTNIYAIVSFLLCMCALSLIDFWMKRQNWFILVRIILLLAIWSISSGFIGTLVLSILAFIDARADFRKLDREL